MYLTGQSGQEGDQATLASHHMELYEGITKCVTFWFWLEAGEDSSVRSLTVLTEDTGGNVVSPWHSNLSTSAWTEGQVGFTRGGDLRIKFRVEHGPGSQGGFVGLDDVEINTWEMTADQEHKCPLLPPPEDATTRQPCNEGDFSCGDGSCLASSKVCNFVFDCDNDEDLCPEMTTFDDCSDLVSCHWREGTEDELNWVLADISQSPQPGPKLTFQNSTEGKFLLVKPRSSLVMLGTAELLSPEYRDSNPACRLTFWMFLAGGSQTDLTVFPVLSEKSGHTMLDRLDSRVLTEGSWTKVEIGLGRQQGPFSFSLSLHYDAQSDQASYDGGVAVDDLALFECALPPPSDHCRQETEFQCVTTKGCISLTQTCDLADNCGDYSDELFNCKDFTRFNFENPDQPFGFFNQDDTTPEFSWKRGNGSLGLGQTGSGPPFDHTDFNPGGHFLYIDSAVQSGGERAWLNSPFLLTSDQECRLRFFYHLHGRSVGDLSVYRESVSSRLD